MELNVDGEGFLLNRDDWTPEIAREIAAKPPAAMRHAKALLKADLAEVEAAIDAEVAAYAERLASAELKEAVTAFLEKRPPDFSKAE